MIKYKNKIKEIKKKKKLGLSPTLQKLLYIYFLMYYIYVYIHTHIYNFFMNYMYIYIHTYVEFEHASYSFHLPPLYDFLLEHMYIILLLSLFILGCAGGLTREKINCVNGGLFSTTMLENHKILMYIMQSKDVKTYTISTTYMYICR